MKQLKAAAVCLVLLAAAGCGRSVPSTFYLLKPIEAPPEQAGFGSLSLGVGPVDIPDYLRRPQIARRSSGSEIAYPDASRWAEPLDTAVLRVLSENLSLLAGTRNITLFPWAPSAAPDYQVRVRIVTFDGSVEKIQLIAYWSLYGTKQKAELAARKSLIEEKPAGETIAALVEAQNRALEKLSREIAAELRRIETES